MSRSARVYGSAILAIALAATPGAAVAVDDPVISFPPGGAVASDGSVASPASPELRGDAAKQIAKIMARMSLKEKIGQLFVLQFAGQSASAPDSTSAATNLAQYGVRKPSKIIKRYHPGGVIYFGSNVADPTQAASLSDGLQRAALKKSPNVPLAISTDQEGGSVTRFEAPATVSPGNMAVGATFKTGKAKKIADVLGSEMAAMGVRYNLAPVVDVNTNPLNPTDGTRSFGDRPDQVSDFTTAAVKGQQRTKVAVTAKHFPGLGSTTTDTDIQPTVSNQTKRQFKKLDFPPFRAAIAAKTDSVMVSHLIAPALDSTRTPASLSKPMVTGLLRKKLGFEGVAITDALVAGALKQWSARTLAVRAVRAGNDMLLMPRNLKKSIKGLEKAVRSGSISRKRLDTSVQRILELKQKAGILSSPWSAKPAALSRIVGSQSHLDTAQNIADQATTLISRSESGAPIQAGSKVLLTGAGFGSTLPSIGQMLTDSGAVVDQVPTGNEPTSGGIEAAVAAAPGNDVVVILTYNAWGSPGQQQLIKELTELTPAVPVILAFLATPYDAALAPNARANIAIYSDMPPSREALVKTLFGREPTGRLPVTIHSLSDPNQVLFDYGRGLGWD